MPEHHVRLFVDGCLLEGTLRTRGDLRGVPVVSARVGRAWIRRLLYDVPRGERHAYLAGLRGLGVVTTADLLGLTESDLLGAGIKLAPARIILSYGPVTR